MLKSAHKHKEVCLNKVNSFYEKIPQYLQDNGDGIMKMKIMCILYKKVVGRDNASYFENVFFLGYLLPLKYEKYLSMHLSLCMYVYVCVCIYLYSISNLKLSTTSVSLDLFPL